MGGKTRNMKNNPLYSLPYYYDYNKILLKLKDTETHQKTLFIEFVLKFVVHVTLITF